MPYIPQQRRIELEKIPLSDLLNGNVHLASGDMNYLISRLLLGQLRIVTNYEAFNKLIGVLECVKLELYRRHTGPYEDLKIKENGKI